MYISPLRFKNISSIFGITTRNAIILDNLSLERKIKNETFLRMTDLFSNRPRANSFIHYNDNHRPELIQQEYGLYQRYFFNDEGLLEIWTYVGTLKDGKRLTAKNYLELQDEFTLSVVSKFDEDYNPVETLSYFTEGEKAGRLSFRIVMAGAFEERTGIIEYDDGTTKINFNSSTVSLDKETTSRSGLANSITTVLSTNGVATFKVFIVLTKLGKDDQESQYEAHIETEAGEYIFGTNSRIISYVEDDWATNIYYDDDGMITSMETQAFNVRGTRKKTYSEFRYDIRKGDLHTYEAFAGYDEVNGKGQRERRVNTITTIVPSEMTSTHQHPNHQ